METEKQEDSVNSPPSEGPWWSSGCDSLGCVEGAAWQQEQPWGSIWAPSIQKRLILGTHCGSDLGSCHEEWCASCCRGIRDVGLGDRAVLMGGGWRIYNANPNLEGLPVDGTRSVFFIFPLGHPHLLKGVQRCQDGATVRGERAVNSGERTQGSDPKYQPKITGTQMVLFH